LPLGVKISSFGQTRNINEYFLVFEGYFPMENRQELRQLVKLDYGVDLDIRQLKQ